MIGVSYRYDVDIAVETPEGVTLRVRPAGPAPRLAAYLFDLAVRIAFLQFLSALASLAGLAGGVSLSAGLTLLGLFAIEWGYSTAFETFWHGSTPGKKIFGLRVLKSNGAPIGFREAALRNLMRAADGFPIYSWSFPLPTYGVALATSLLDSRFRRLGDLAGGTMVVRERREAAIERVRLPPGLEPLPPGAAAGRKPREKTLDLIERLAARREELGHRRAQELAGRIAVPLARRLGGGDLLLAEARRDPLRFALRVLKTYRGEETAGAPEFAAGGGAQWRR